MFTLQSDQCEEKPDGGSREEKVVLIMVITVRSTALKRKHCLTYLNKNIGRLKVFIFIIYQKEPERDKDVYSLLLEYDKSQLLSPYQSYV